MSPATQKNVRRERRRLSTRAHLRRTSDRPRLSVFRSVQHISAQVIDDSKGHTVAAATTSAKAMREALDGKTKTEQAKLIGREIAKKALGAGVSSVVFDRGCYRFHGRVKALADAAREAGLKF
ncbi:MAG: 50S ribosomal protein L18 [Planctomycetes bacterium]|nr:50S ribosomal protein L18 [Planctomycetota bacterium]